jgi:hypothetical protein
MQATGTQRLGRVHRLVWLAIMLVTAPVFALRPPDDGGAQPVSEPPAALPAQAPDTQKSPAAGNIPRQVPKPAVPRSSADSFTPSERIKADSAVSFPVDI